jgi:hypothetical protein
MSKEKTGGHWKNRRRAIIGMHDTYKLQMVVEDQIMSKSSKWITDRLPREEDGSIWLIGQVWISGVDGVYTTHWSEVNEWQPWQPILAPSPKPKESSHE